MRSHNTIAHPGIVDISIEEVGDDYIYPKDSTSTKEDNSQNLKSAEEIAAGLQ